ncbi:MAG: hypothetical protein ABW091_14740, partial [Microbacterium sp.]
MTLEPTRRRAVAKPALLASVALVAAATLLGGPASYALWNDQAAQGPHIMDSARGITLAATVTSAPFAVGTLSSTVATSTAGIIPGTRGQRLTFSLKTGATNGVQGYVTGTIAAAAKTAWASVYTAGYLTTTATSSGTCVVNPAPAVVGGALTWTFSTAAGQSMTSSQTCTIVLDLSIPAVKNGVDVSRALLAVRGTTTVLNPLADFTATGLLTQVP